MIKIHGRCIASLNTNCYATFHEKSHIYYTTGSMMYVLVSGLGFLKRALILRPHLLMIPISVIIV